MLRWAGGKGRIVEQVIENLPTTIDTYIEPLAGGAAVFFELAHRGVIKGAAVLSDSNAALVNFYQQIQTEPGIVHGWMEKRADEHEEQRYYELRKFFNAGSGGNSNAWKAATFWYLNHACFNALWRVHQKTGHFNVPWGRKKEIHVPPLEDVIAYSKLLSRCDIAVSDFSDPLAIARQRADLHDRVAVYLDPPYINTFKTYAKSFGEADQRRLAAAARETAAAGAHVLLSINDCPLARELYDDGTCILREVTVRHAVGAKEERRKDVAELLVHVRV
jgi:DNA adenine methylase